MSRRGWCFDLLLFKYTAIVGEMPDEMKNACKRHSYSEFHMPFQDCFYKRQIPFIGDLKGHKQACNSGSNECSRKKDVPELFMEAAGNEVYPVKKVT
jgi:hypothetical protein